MTKEDKYLKAKEFLKSKGSVLSYNKMTPTATVMVEYADQQTKELTEEVNKREWHIIDLAEKNIKQRTTIEKQRKEIEELKEDKIKRTKFIDALEQEMCKEKDCNHSAENHMGNAINDWRDRVAQLKAEAKEKDERLKDITTNTNEFLSRLEKNVSIPKIGLRQLNELKELLNK